MEKINVIIVHGAYGHPKENWFDWLREELAHININCLVPQLPTPQNQTLENWLETFNQICLEFISEKTILIGHSLGAAFLLRWLEKYDGPLFSVILVSPFVGKVGFAHFDLLNESFFQDPFDWQKITTPLQQFFCYYGTNDKYVTRKNFNYISENLKAKPIIISNAGHIHAATGYTKFQHLLLHIKQLSEISDD